jgi:hypothetical protein
MSTFAASGMGASEPRAWWRRCVARAWPWAVALALAMCWDRAV